MTGKELRQLAKEGEWMLKRAYYKKVCKSKVKYKSFDEAKAAVENRTKEFNTPMYHYICPYSVGKKGMATHWHLSTRK